MLYVIHYCEIKNLIGKTFFRLCEQEIGLLPLSLSFSLSYKSNTAALLNHAHTDNTSDLPKHYLCTKTTASGSRQQQLARSYSLRVNMLVFGLVLAATSFYDVLCLSQQRFFSTLQQKLTSVCIYTHTYIHIFTLYTSIISFKYTNVYFWLDFMTIPGKLSFLKEINPLY